MSVASGVPQLATWHQGTPSGARGCHVAPGTPLWSPGDATWHQGPPSEAPGDATWHHGNPPEPPGMPRGTEDFPSDLPGVPSRPSPLRIHGMLVPVPVPSSVPVPEQGHGRSLWKVHCLSCALWVLPDALWAQCRCVGSTCGASQYPKLQF